MLGAYDIGWIGYQSRTSRIRKSIAAISTAIHQLSREQGAFKIEARTARVNRPVETRNL